LALRKGEVLFKDKPAGTLEETASGGSRFVYSEGWKEPIACCFPLSKREHEWQTGLHPFFQHIGTEGWLREEQARSAHIQQDDDLGLLLRYGADCIGAVSIKALDKKDVPVITEATVSPGRTVSGVQKKLLVVAGQNGQFVPASAEGPAPYIAKFNSEKVNSLVRNEALSLRWCVAVLGADDVTSFQVATVNNKGATEGALVVKRFDRTPQDAKLRLEDFAQILSKSRGADYAGKYDASYEDVARVIKEHSARPQIDLLKLFRRLVVFALIGNCDGHLKNFSLLETPQGLRLSPLYDVLNSAIYDNYDRNLALSINGKKVQLDAVTRALLADFGKSIGLPARAITQAFDELKRKIKGEAAKNILAPPEGEPPEGFFHRYAEIVNNACLRILET
jgi:serine/threonine-protein kinase HipA